MTLAIDALVDTRFRSINQMPHIAPYSHLVRHFANAVNLFDLRTGMRITWASLTDVKKESTETPKAAPKIDNLSCFFINQNL